LGEITAAHKLRMFTRNKKDLAKSLPRKMLRFCHNFVDVKCHPEDRIIPRETAILTIVDTFIGKIERCEDPHGPPKILQRERAGSLRHGFESLIRLRGNQMLKALDQLRFSQRKAVQCFNKRHHNNFVSTVTFASLARTIKRCPLSRRRYSKRFCEGLRTRNSRPCGPSQNYYSARPRNSS